MSEKFVPYQKMSKKAKHDHDAMRRLGWGGVNPASRVEPDRTKFTKKDRRETKAALRRV